MSSARGLELVTLSFTDFVETLSVSLLLSNSNVYYREGVVVWVYVIIFIIVRSRIKVQS